MKLNTIILPVEDHFQTIRVIEREINSGIHQKPYEVLCIVHSEVVANRYRLAGQYLDEIEMAEQEAGSAVVHPKVYDRILSEKAAELAKAEDCRMDDAAKCLVNILKGIK